MLGDLKTKVSSFMASLLSVLGIGGTGVSAVCQATCVSTPSVLPILGISLAATPFAFVSQYQAYIWWIAAVVFLLVLLFAQKKGILRTKTDKLLITINFSLLVVGFPYFRAQLQTVFIFAGAVLITLAILFAIGSEIYDL